jgi:prepilin-type N-terminal cleavage/methylation domain-containing protein
MRRRDSGFTLLELLLTIGIVSLVLSAAITFFTAVVRQYKVQTKITETNVEGVIGLEILRQDMESLGFGLPWNNVGSVNYNEAASGRLNDSPSAPPRAVVSVETPSYTVNNSDYLVIKSARVGTGAAAGKWTTLNSSGGKRDWGFAEETLSNTDYVVVLWPGNSDASWRSLVAPGGTFSAQYSGTTAASGYAPLEPFDTNIVYGIGAQTLRMPFNRADYYIDNTAIPVPRHCAPVTGTLVKRVVRHSDGALDDPLPLLDCAADMQMVYGLDDDADGDVDTWSFDISTGMTAEDIRNRLIEVRLHVLAQEGQRDDSYRPPTDNVFVGSQGVGRNFDLASYRNYRWKLYNIVVKPTNLAR